MYTLYKGQFIDVKTASHKTSVIKEPSYLELKSIAGIKLNSLINSRRILYHIKPFECGWTDGGCRILANAFHHCLQALELKSSLKYLIYDYEGDTFVDHVVCELQLGPKKLYLDANGFFTRTDLESYWRLTERSDVPKKAIYLSDKSPGIQEILEQENVSKLVSFSIKKQFNDILFKDLKI